MAPVQRAVGDGRIVVAEPWLLSTSDAPAEAAGVIALGASGECVFHQRDPPSRFAPRRTGRCAIHGAIGHEALPSACQHFPRVCLIDPRGVFVTLSHFCPTAATMLFDEAPVSIVEGPPAVPGGGEPEGLDARDTWPPLRTDRVLMDLEEYGRWERHMVSVLAGKGRAESPESALARLRADASAFALGATADKSAWQAHRCADARSAATPSNDRSPGSVYSLFDRVRAAVPMPLTWPEAPDGMEDAWAERVEPTWPTGAPVVQRFLAAHAFGSWIAYQGRGLHAIVSGLEAALAVLKIEVVRTSHTRAAVLDRASLHESIRRADLLLRHYVDRQAFADAMSSWSG